MRRLPLRGAPNRIPSQQTTTWVVTIRVKRNTNRITSHLAVLPRAISIIRKIRVKRNTNRIASYLEVLPRAISKIRKIRVKKTTHTAVPHVDLLSGTTWVVTRNVKSKFFRAKNFNIFYIFGREKFSISAIRAPIKPRKFPIKPVENPQKHIEFPSSDVFLPLYGAKKEERTPCLGLFPLR